MAVCEMVAQMSVKQCFKSLMFPAAAAEESCDYGVHRALRVVATSSSKNMQDLG